MNGATNHESQITNHGLPWSQPLERALSRTIWGFWGLMLCAAVGAPIMALERSWALFAANLVVFVFALRMLFIQRERLAEMLRNKPRDPAAVTPYALWSPWTQSFDCACGELLTFRLATWFPNSVDAGGGRWAIVCPACSRGHYKLKIRES